MQVRLRRHVVLLQRVIGRIIRLRASTRLLFLVSVSDRRTFNVRGVFEAVRRMVVVVTRTRTARTDLRDGLCERILITKRRSCVSFARHVALYNEPILRPFVREQRVVGCLQDGNASWFRHRLPRVVPMIRQRVHAMGAQFPFLSFRRVQGVPIRPMREDRSSRAIFQEGVPRVASFRIRVIRHAMDHASVTPINSLLDRFSKRHLREDNFPNSRQARVHHVVGNLLQDHQLLRLKRSVRLGNVRRLKIMLVFRCRHPIRYEVFLPSVLHACHDYKPRANTGRCHACMFRLALRFWIFPNSFRSFQQYRRQPSGSTTGAAGAI